MVDNRPVVSPASPGPPDGGGRVQCIIARLTEPVARLANGLEMASKTDVRLRGRCFPPRIGAVAAVTVTAFAPDPDTFDSERNLTAWLARVPRQRSTGSDTRLGPVSKTGQTDIRRLPIVGAMRDPPGGPQELQHAPLARTAGVAQAKDGRGRRAGEQDGPQDPASGANPVPLYDWIIMGGRGGPLPELALG